MPRCYILYKLLIINAIYYFVDFFIAISGCDCKCWQQFLQYSCNFLAFLLRFPVFGQLFVRLFVQLFVQLFVRRIWFIHFLSASISSACTRVCVH